MPQASPQIPRWQKSHRWILCVLFAVGCAAAVRVSEAHVGWRCGRLRVWRWTVRPGRGIVEIEQVFIPKQSGVLVTPLVFVDRAGPERVGLVSRFGRGGFDIGGGRCLGGCGVLCNAPAAPPDAAFGSGEDEVCVEECMEEEREAGRGWLFSPSSGDE